MKNSLGFKIAIANRLRNLDEATQKDLEDIKRMACIVCETPVATIGMLNREIMSLTYHINGSDTEMTVDDAFCRDVIRLECLQEIPDVQANEMFNTSPLSVDGKPVRFYAGVPLKAASGEVVGTFCVVDTQPRALTGLQKRVLHVLSRQIVSTFEFEYSLHMLRKEIDKVQNSEMKLNSMFESSPTAHILLNKDRVVLTFNKAATDFLNRLLHKQIAEGECITSLLSGRGAALFDAHFAKALSGERVSVEEKITYEGAGEVWWSLSFNPAYGYANAIIGVSYDATDITELMVSKQHLISQNEALKEIAQIQSHDMRQPVANLVGLTDMLDDCNDEHYDENLQFMKQEIHKLDDKIHQIVQVSSENNLFE